MPDRMPDYKCASRSASRSARRSPRSRSTPRRSISPRSTNEPKSCFRPRASTSPRPLISVPARVSSRSTAAAANSSSRSTKRLHRRRHRRRSEAIEVARSRQCPDGVFQVGTAAALDPAVPWHVVVCRSFAGDGRPRTTCAVCSRACSRRRRTRSRSLEYPTSAGSGCCTRSPRSAPTPFRLRSR